jgi:hypothetical protein
MRLGLRAAFSLASRVEIFSISIFLLLNQRSSFPVGLNEVRIQGSAKRSSRASSILRYTPTNPSAVSDPCRPSPNLLESPFQFPISRGAHWAGETSRMMQG